MKLPSHTLESALDNCPTAAAKTSSWDDDDNCSVTQLGTKFEREITYENFQLTPSEGNNWPLQSSILETCDWSSPFEVINLYQSHHLREWSLSGCFFNGPTPTWVWNTTEQIDSSNNGFTVNVTKYSSESKLHRLTLEGNNLQGRIPQWISQLVNLESFDISSNNLSGVVQLEMFASLHKLDLFSFCKVC